MRFKRQKGIQQKLTFPPVGILINQVRHMSRFSDLGTKGFIELNPHSQFPFQIRTLVPFPIRQQQPCFKIS
ncbi:conserved hypothetical protein [Ricinus communis]|uniref:Uncharacterized protein n=1 Tax=Ricinus communis TaxID=3988 RepID=B9S280_RICCO|nr:conserved hypothetical protein [Ricinus communis]